MTRCKGEQLFFVALHETLSPSLRPKRTATRGLCVSQCFAQRVSVTNETFLVNRLQYQIDTKFRKAWF